MTWHKMGTRYNPQNLVHPSDAESWTHVNGIHRQKAKEARNVRVALSTDGFNPYGMSSAPLHLLARFRYLPQSSPRRHLPTTEHILAVDNS